LSRPLRALGVEHAVRDARDVGAAIVGDDGVQHIPITWHGRPEAATLTRWIRDVAAAYAVQVVSIDGPLGWKGPDTDSLHCRRSERVVRAPGKTGLPPDGVKPATYLGFTRLSIALFERLTIDGTWRLPGDPRGEAPPAVLVTECFPTAIWRGLGVPPLPGKSKATGRDVEQAAMRLASATGLTMPAAVSHDALQAVVAAYAGWRLAHRDPRVHLAGDPPFRLDGAWREGYILSIAPTGGG
jgi:hypothetical protein